MSLREVDRIGNDDLHRHRTDDITVEHHVDLNSTVSETGEYTVSRNGSKSVIADCPSSALGDVRLVAGRADTRSGHLNGGTDGGILVRAVDLSVIELGGAGRGGNHQERRGNRTGETVRGRVDHLKSSCAGLLSHEGSGSAAVQVDSVYAACLEHDLSDLLHATAARARLLTTVEYHEYDLTGLGDTDSSSGCTAGVVGFRSGNNNLTVLDQHGTEAADGLLQLVLIVGVVLSSRTDNGLAVLGDTEEAGTTDTVVELTVHDQQTTGLTGRHVEAVCVHTDDNVVVGDVVGACGIAAVSLSSVCLIDNALHLPTLGRIVISVVCKHVYIIAGDICGGDVVDHLLIVSGRCVVNLLGDTGSQLSDGRREGIVVHVLVVSYVVTCELAEVICECVNDSASERGQILGTGEVSRTLQSGDQHVIQILLICRVSDLSASTVGTQSVGHEVCGTVLVREILGHVVQEDLCQRIDTVIDGDFTVFADGYAVLYGLEHVHHVERIQVAVVVLTAEAGIVGLVNGREEAILTDGDNHLLKSTVHALQSRNLQEVNQVAGPTGHVGMVFAVVVVVGDVHGTEDVTDVSLVTIGKSELSEILQAGNGNIISIRNGGVSRVLHLGYVFCEIRILVTGHDTPRAGIVALYTGTDVLDHESYGILRGILLHVVVCDQLEQVQVVDEVFVVVDVCLAEHGDNNDIGGLTALLASLVCLVTVFGTGGSLSIDVGPLMTVIGLLLSDDDLATHEAVRAGSQPLITAVTRYGRIDHFAVTVSGNSLLSNNGLATSAAVRTGSQTGCGTSRSHSSVGHLNVTESLAQFFAASRAVTRIGTGCTLGQAMIRGRNSLLRNDNLVTGRAMRTLGQTGFGTGRSYGSISHLSVTGSGNSLLRSDNLVTGRAMRSSSQAGLGTGRSLCLVDHLGMTGCGHNLLCNNNLTATIAVRAGSQTGSGTGRSLCLVRHLVMTESGFQFSAAHRTGLRILAVSICTKSVRLFVNNLLRSDNLVTGRAMRSSSQTSLGTGRSLCLVDHLGMTGCGYSLLRIDNLVTGRAMRTLGQTGFCTGGSHSLIGHLGVTGSINSLLRNESLATGRAVLPLGQTGYGTSGRNRRQGRLGMPTSGFDPFTVLIHILSRIAHTVQGNGLDRNIVVIQRLAIITGLMYLIGNRIRTGIQLNDRAILGSDARAGGSYVDVSRRCIDHTGNVNMGIRIRCMEGNIGGLAGCILDGSYVSFLGSKINDVAVAVLRIDPFLCIVNVNLITPAQHTRSPLVDDNFSTGKQSNILRNGNIASLISGNGNVTVNRQHVVAGSNGPHAIHGNRQTLHGDIAIDGNIQPIVRFIVILDKIAGCDVEHTVRPDKGNRRSINARISKE